MNQIVVTSPIPAGSAELPSDVDNSGLFPIRRVAPGIPGGKEIFLVILLSIACRGIGLFAQEPPDALRMYRDGEYAEAIQVCFAELKETPRNMNSYAVLCWSMLRLERYQEALDYGMQGLEISRYDPRMVEAVGEAHFYLGKNLEALQYFEEYAVLAPTGDRVDSAYYFMGEIFIRLGEYNHADIALTTAVYHSPNTARWWTRLGYAREMAEDYRYSLLAYEKALQLNPSSQDAIRGTERVREQLDNG